MKLIKILIAVLMVFGVAQASAKEPKAPKAIVVYAVGVATSFNDSVAYFTEMQVLNDATLDRDRYLHRRSGYSPLRAGERKLYLPGLVQCQKSEIGERVGQGKSSFLKRQHKFD